MNYLPLLMTASVDPRGMKFAMFSPEERETMYLSALQFYKSTLADIDCKIIFVDNSGWGLNNIKAQLQPYDSNKIEFISLDPNLFDVSRGKGYNEFLLMQMAIEQSQTIKEKGAFLKVTGRYPIFNIRHFLDEGSTIILKDGRDVYADLKKHNLYKNLGLNWTGSTAESRLFGLRTSFFRDYLMIVAHKLDYNNGYMLESMLYDNISCHIGNPQLVCRFTREPHYGGLSGSLINSVSFSANYDSFFWNLKRHVKNFSRRFFPDFWI